MNKNIEDFMQPNWTKKHTKTFTKGSMGQTEIHHYDIFDENNNLVGEIRVTESTQLRGLQTTTHAEWITKK